MAELSLWVYRCRGKELTFVERLIAALASYNGSCVFSVHFETATRGLLNNINGMIGRLFTKS